MDWYYFWILAMFKSKLLMLIHLLGIISKGGMHVCPANETIMRKCIWKPFTELREAATRRKRTNKVLGTKSLVGFIAFAAVSQIDRQKRINLAWLMHDWNACLLDVSAHADLLLKLSSVHRVSNIIAQAGVVVANASSLFGDEKPSCTGNDDVPSIFSLFWVHHSQRETQESHAMASTT